MRQYPHCESGEILPVLLVEHATCVPQHVRAHTHTPKTPLANLVRWKDKPVALSIVQARLVGLAHFAAGYVFTYAAFLIASTSGKFG